VIEAAFNQMDGRDGWVCVPQTIEATSARVLPRLSGLPVSARDHHQGQEGHKGSQKSPQSTHAVFLSIGSYHRPRNP
jgi:hypothetical protein